MQPRKDLKMLTMRHFLFYMGLACIAGAIIGAAAGLMDWSDGLIYGVGVPVGLLIALTGVREGLLAPAQRPDQRHGRHA